MTITEFINKYSFLIEKNFVDNPRKEILYFVSCFDNIEMTKLFGNYNYEVKNIRKIVAALKRRSKGESVASIVGVKEFYNCIFLVSKYVLIPRPETEFLVDEAISLIKENKLKRVLDLCSGPGTIGLSIMKNVNNIDLTMVDISKRACSLAKKNIILNDIKFESVKIFSKDLLNRNIDNYFKEKFDLIVSNPPYIEKEKVKEITENREVSDPFLTLDGGESGLDFYYRINEFCVKNLSISGYIIVEIGYDQKSKVQEIFKSFKFIKCIKDFGGSDRVLVFGNS